MPASLNLALRVLVAAPLVASLAAPSLAQNELSRRELMRMATAIQSKVKSPLSAADRQAVEKFFQEHYFPSMTESGTDALEELGEKRADLFDRFIWDADPSAQRVLTAEAYKFSRAVLSGRQYPGGNARARYSPPVKVNATLILGLLDDKYATRADPSVKPSAVANRLLAQIVVLSVDKQTFPSYLESSALTGLKRHTRNLAGLDTQAKNNTARALLKAASQQQYRSPTPRDARNWIKLQAAEGIANFKVAGPKGVFVMAIAGLVQDQKADLHTRCSALELLKNVDFKGAPPAVVQQAVGAAKRITCDVTTQERTYVEEIRELAGRAGRRVDSQDTNIRFKHDDQIGWQYERRGLVTHLTMLNAGLGAVQAVAGADAGSVESVAAAVQSTITMAEEEDNPYDLLGSIEEMCDEVSRSFGCQAPAAEGAEGVAAGGLLPGSEVN